jgi:hypothetical protein
VADYPGVVVFASDRPHLIADDWRRWSVRDGRGSIPDPAGRPVTPAGAVPAPGCGRWASGRPSSRC